MNYPQLWRTSGIVFSLLSAALAAPSVQAAGHTVRSGDTFTSIAKKYKVSIATLQKANPKVKPSVIAKGQVLKLPGDPAAKQIVTAPSKTGKIAAAKSKPDSTSKSSKATSPIDESPRLAATKPGKRSGGYTITTYRVRAGDTASALARRSGISVGELAEMNALDRLDLQEGQKLVLPAGSSPASVPREDRENTVDITPPSRKPASGETQPRRSAPPPNPPATPGTYYHVVKRGETFSSIAREKKVSLTALTKANETVNPTRLNVGQQLNVPGLQVASHRTRDEFIDETPSARTTSYRFDDRTQPGTFDSADGHVPSIAYRFTTRDTEESLAREFNSSPSELRRLNQMGPFDQFTPGSYIQVPWQNQSRPD